MLTLFRTQVTGLALGLFWLLASPAAQANGKTFATDPSPNQSRNTPASQSAPTHQAEQSQHSLQTSTTGDGETIFRLVAEAVMKNDPAWKEGQHKARQFKQLATARSALPNPLFTTGLFNVPFDGLSLTENPTTQWRFGLKQGIPRGKTRQLLKEQSLAIAQSHDFDSQDDYLQRVRKTQQLWLELYFLQQKKRIIVENRQLLSELVKLAENRLAEGRAQQQDVIQARLEWLRLKDELIRVTDQMAAGEAEYHRMAGHGDPAWPPLPASAPEVKIAAESFARHPAILRIEAQIHSAEKAIALAREKKKPQWMVGGEYRARFGSDANGAERNDLFALTASIDLPFARRSATNAEVAAAIAAREAAQDRRESQWLGLQAEWGRARSQWRQSRMASELYNDRLLREAWLNVQAAEDAYSAGTGDFTAVILAQKNLLKTQLEAIGWQVNQWRSWVSLSYLQGLWLPLLDSAQARNQNTAGPTGLNNRHPHEGTGEWQ